MLAFKMWVCFKCDTILILLVENENWIKKKTIDTVLIIDIKFHIWSSLERTLYQ